MTILDHDIHDLGLVQYKNVLPESSKIIEIVEDLATRIANKEHGDSHTIAMEWEAWEDAHIGKPFNYKFYVFREVPENDYYYNELSEIGKLLYGPLDKCFAHYSKVLYPLASAAVKSEEMGDGILKYVDGGHLPAHQDLGVSSRVISSVSYLSDDYEGGEIEFAQSNVTIKPSAGDIIFFPSNFLYMHEVKPISNGIRYAMPHWYHHLKTPRLSDGTE